MIASSRLLSSPVSCPLNSTRTSRPHVRARSLTIRGNFPNRFPTGCIRACITVSRRSAVTLSSRRASSGKFAASIPLCSIWLRVNTSSPTRFIMRFSTSTSIRSVLSALAFSVTTVGCSAGDPPLFEATGAAPSLFVVSTSAICGASISGNSAGTCPFNIASSAISSPSSSPARVPSLPVSSISTRIARSPSIKRSNPLIKSELTASLPSRSDPSRCSPACASFSSRSKPRNPVVPLIV